MSGQTRVTFFAGLATMLAAVAFTPVFTVQTWFWPMLVALMLIGGVGVLLRRRSAPAAGVILAQVVVVALWITWLYAPSAVLGLLPGPGAFRDFADLASAGLTDANDYGTPVPATDGLEFLTVLGISGVGVIVDALAVTFRQAALAGLPLLALYTVPASVVDGGLNWFLFVLAAAGYIALLIAEGRDRLSRWGRPLIAASSSPSRAGRGTVAEVETAPFGQVGRRIGAAVIGLAIVVPAVFPLADNALTKGGGLFGDNGKGGDNTVTTINPLVSLRREFWRPENVPIMTVKTDAKSPENLYLRMATLETFDGTDWKRSDTDLTRIDELPAITDLTDAVARTEVHAEIKTTKNIESSFLPVPYPLTDIKNLAGSWRVDVNTQNVLSANTRQLQDKDYTTTSLDVQPTPKQLADAAGSPPGEAYAADLTTPQGLPENVRQLALQVTEGAVTPYDKALRLQDWLRSSGGFVYDTSTRREGTGATAIEQFLSDKHGYCEQFASTMAVMARILGIPARVNIGFTMGQRQPDGSYLVSSHDSHAWPELYFTNIGWTRFEPTPIGTGGADPGRGSVPAYATAPDQDTATGQTANSDTTGGSDATEPTAGAAADPTQSSIPPQCRDLVAQLLRECLAANSGATAPSGRTIPLWLLIGAPIVIGLLLTPGLSRVAIRRRRYRLAGSNAIAQANAAWAELRDAALDLGYSWAPSETPRQSAARLARKAKLRHRHEEALSRLTTTVEHARYAPVASDTSTAAADVRLVRAGLARRVGRAQRLRSVVLPASTVVLLHWAGERIADILDAIDRTGTALKRRALSVIRRPGTAQS